MKLQTTLQGSPSGHLHVKARFFCDLDQARGVICATEDGVGDAAKERGGDASAPCAGLPETR